MSKRITPDELALKYALRLAKGGHVDPYSYRDGQTIHYPQEVSYEAISILLSEGLAYQSDYSQHPSNNEFRGTSKLKKLYENGRLEQHLNGSNSFLEAWHPEIEAHSRDLYSKGRYDSAIMEATKRLEIAIRESSKSLNGMLGDSLAVHAFKPGGPLNYPARDGSDDRGFQFLAQGCFAAFRNPTHHYDTGYTDPVETGQILCFLSYMISVVQKRKTQNSDQ